jgi:hypothetical protein
LVSSTEMRRTALLVLTLGAGAACACAAIADFDALHPVDDAGASGDGAASDGPATGEGGDGGSQDVSAPPADADAASPCATDAHAFCEDFDLGVLNVVQKWPSQDDRGGVRFFDDTFHVSPPFSYGMKSGDAAASSLSYIGLELRAPSGQTFHGRMHVSFDLLVVDSGGAKPMINEIRFYLPDGGGGGSSQWFADQSGDTVGLNDPSGGSGSPAQSRGGGWRHLDVYFTFSEDGGPQPSGYDTVTVAPVSLVLPPPDRITMQPGVRNHDEGTLPSVRIDNVVIDFEP